MRAWYFSENAYPYLPDQDTYDSIRVTLPNKHYDPKIGADLYHRFIDEWCLADELGLDIMTNEHHQTATCTVPAVPIMIGILARETKNARLLVLGNPIANRRQPVRVAEEMAMVDVLSRGRLEVGFVRSVPYELSAANSSPVRTFERMWEAHDLIIKAWTAHDGPFNFEGRFFHHRQVNIWPRPYQQPHPPVWITVGSPGNAAAVAKYDYTAAAFLTGYDWSKVIFDAYRESHKEAGHAGAANDRIAYAALVYTGETDEAGYEGARKLMWYMQANKVPPHFRNPPGYLSPQLAAKFMKGGLQGGVGTAASSTLEEQIERGNIFAGSPDTVYRGLRDHYDRVGGYGHLLLMGQAGFLEHDETVTGIKMFANEVYPRLKELIAVDAPAA